MTPDRLSQGWLDAQGVERHEVTTTWAQEAAQQLMQAGILPAELDAVLAPLLRASPPGGAADVRAFHAAADGVQGAAAVRGFVLPRVHAVATVRDLAAFHHHVGAVLRLLAVNEAAVLARRKIR